MKMAKGARTNTPEMNMQPSSAEQGTSKKRCFVISPIGEEGSEGRRHADWVYTKLVKPALQQFGISSLRADEMKVPGDINAHILRAILDFELCIAVLTDHNPNVFYEVGVAHAARRPLSSCCKRGSALHSTSMSTDT